MYLEAIDYVIDGGNPEELMPANLPVSASFSLVDWHQALTIMNLWNRMDDVSLDKLYLTEESWDSAYLIAEELMIINKEEES